MDIRIKEPLYISQNGQEYIVRPATVGVERNKLIFFYDVTKTASVGFPKEFCLETPQLFQVARTMSDKEVSLRDVILTVEKWRTTSPHSELLLIEQLKNL